MGWVGGCGDVRLGWGWVRGEGVEEGVVGTGRGGGGGGGGYGEGGYWEGYINIYIYRIYIYMYIYIYISIIHIYIYINYQYSYIYTYISKMVTFIDMVITRVKNGSPDMILTAFDGKFNEKKDEIPPGACNPSYISNYSILGV